MWPDYLDNPQAIYSAFPNAVPDLKGLRPGKLVIDFAGGILLGLEVQPLPDGSPPRWCEQGNDSLEYRFMFYDTSDLSVLGTAQHLAPGVTLELDGGAASLFSQDITFKATFKFRGVRIFLHPFSQTRRLDLQESWPGS
jgi:hypothetical protein